jgi:hypothetical protein
MHLTCMVLRDNTNKPKLIQVGILACLINGQIMNIDMFKNLVCKLFNEANTLMNNEVNQNINLAKPTNMFTNLFKITVTFEWFSFAISYKGM